MKWFGNFASARETGRLFVLATMAAAAFCAFGGELPTGYVRCEYVESTGYEFVKTDFSPDGNTRFVLDYQMLADYAPDSTEVPAMGINTGDGQFGIGAGPLNGEFVVRARARTDWNAYTLVEGTSGYARNTVELRGDGTILVNGDEIEEKQPGLNKTSSCDGGMYLFAINESQLTRYRCVARVWGCQLYDGDALRRDFVPCYEASSRAFGLYDVANGKFYGNASGKGAFTGPLEPRALGCGDWRRFECESTISFGRSGLAAPIADVPVLVRVSEAAIPGFRHADCFYDKKRGMADVAFAVVGSGEWLDYEVENWDPAGESQIWIRVPKLKRTTRVKMYWGLRPGCDPAPYDGTKMWRDLDYAAVMHLNWNDGRDSTGWSAYGALSSNMTIAEGGPVGKCMGSTSESGFLVVKNQDGQAPWAAALSGTDFTLSFWTRQVEKGFNYPSFLSYGSFRVTGSWTDTVSSGFAFWHENVHVSGFRPAQIGSAAADLPKGMETWDYRGNWVHYTLVSKGLGGRELGFRAYVNGELIKDETASLPNGVASYVGNAGSDLQLVGSGAGSSSKAALMDEVRISSVARDAAYVKFAYNNMVNPQFAAFSAAKKAASPKGGAAVFIGAR
ncbi:MAG: LamG domain-containing protein [Kiritimatiellae bacterium]|nr:LamG domain-containing protein [Kiritimatiellia bacterium]